MNERIGAGTANNFQLNQAPQVQQTVSHPTASAIDVFERLRQCQQRFHQACYQFQQASAERMSAEKELQAASSDASQAINAALADPTQPQQTPPPNGRY